MSKRMIVALCASAGALTGNLFGGLLDLTDNPRPLLSALAAGLVAFVADRLVAQNGSDRPT